MALIENWKSAPKMLVVQVLSTIALVQLVWAELPPEVISKLPANLVHYVTLGLSVFGIIVRVLKQNNLLPGFADTQPQETQDEPDQTNRP